MRNNTIETITDTDGFIAHTDRLLKCGKEYNCFARYWMKGGVKTPNPNVKIIKEA
ncbi:MAG: hypothetical protein ACXQTI_01885 [Candidatus Nezhaarchaeales archaeon]